MRLAYLCLAMACALALLAPTVYSQTMLEYGVTATGGSAMGVAGKGVSDGIDSIFRKLDQQTQNAASTAEQRSEARTTPKENAAETPESAPAVSTAQTRVTSAAVSAPSYSQMLRQSGSNTVWNATVSQPGPPPLTREDLEAVESGQARDEVVARLGAPSARVIIPDGGHLQDVYLYSARQTLLGKVTLVDGAVSSVNVQ